MAARLGLTISYTFYGVCAVISFFLVQSFVHETQRQGAGGDGGLRCLSRLGGGCAIVADGIADDPHACPSVPIARVVRRARPRGHGRALSRALHELRPHAARSCAAGKPIIGIAQSGSDLAPCNRIHLELAERIKAGIRDAGGIPMEFPMHPIFENCRRPTAALDRNLAYLGLVEILNGYPIDAVVLTTGCDKTTPSAIMAAATVDIPAITLSGGPMLDGWHDGELVGSGTVIWRSRRLLGAGEIDEEEFLRRALRLRAVAGPLQHDGHRLDDERDRRRRSACRCRATPRSPRRTASAARWPTNRPAHRRHGV